MLNFSLFIIYSIIINAVFWYQAKKIDEVYFKSFIITTLLINAFSIIMFYSIKTDNYSPIENIYLLSIYCIFFSLIPETFVIFIVIHVLLYCLITRIATKISNDCDIYSFYTIIVNIFLVNTTGILPIMCTQLDGFKSFLM